MPRKRINGIIHGVSLFTEFDIYLFKEGSHFRLYEKLGSHIMDVDGKPGVLFSVWAPNALSVSVMGDFNGWNRDSHKLEVRGDGSGIWEGFVPGIGSGSIYKYFIRSNVNEYEAEKADPFCLFWEVSPRTASIVWDISYDWGDSIWIDNKKLSPSHGQPCSVYEIHPGSWKRVSQEGNRFLTYRELAHELAVYVKDLGYTHVEFLPVMEHPFYGSWGYQVLGFFAPTSRYGSPQDFMYLVDHLHQQGIGVILDWVPSHFPNDEHGLIFFDGTNLFEHADPRQGFHPEWNSYIFNYGRNEVKAFLISSANFWLEKYHADGLRVDAVASMLYLDYSRNPGEWIPNKYGGKENLDALAFIRRMNVIIYHEHPQAETIAEESTAWPMVTRPTYTGGLGFGMKWNMGWMHDTLKYFSFDPVYRKHHHDQLTFSVWYAFAENFMLPLSHDEVVHGKSSLIGKMPGDEWQKFANLRVLMGYMYMHPGKKLLFMGGEFGQSNEWNHDQSLDWHLLAYPPHEGLFKWVRDLNHFYKEEPALFDLDFVPGGFQWIDFGDWEQSIISFMRFDRNGRNILAVFNFTPVPRHNYRIGVPSEGLWKEVLNSDSKEYWGSGQGNLGKVDAVPVSSHGKYFSLTLVLPPLGMVVFRKSE